MQKKWIKLAAAALIAAQLMLPVRAAFTTDDGHVLRSPELLSYYEFPDNWSREALEFCVGNGIMQGRGESLADRENATRAEMATMLVQLLGLSGQADLSAFTDAKPEDWFYDKMAAAVAAGIVSGTSETTLSPNARITREQVVAMLSRAFALNPENPKKWREFSDAGSISAYARPAVSALAERGCLSGYTDGTVRPKANITRAEIAQIFYSLFTCIADSPADLPASGRVLYRGAEPIPGDYALEGSLTVSGQTLSVTGLSVTEELTLRGGEIAVSDCTVPELSVSVGAHVTGNAVPETLRIAGRDSVVELSAGTAFVYGSAKLTGSYEKIVCPGDSVTLELTGTAKSIEMQGRDSRVTGSGSAETVELFGRGDSCDLAAGEVHDRYAEARQEALDTVETMIVWDICTRDTNLYSSSSLSGAIRSLPEGTKLEHYYYHDGSSSASVYTEDGVFGYVPIDAISIPTDYDIREPYEDRIVEGFVNAKGYKSPTDDLIWVNLRTQTVNIFRGKQDEWELVQSFRCCTGKNSTPTVRGVFDVDYKRTEWNFGDYVVCNVTGFYEGYAFHSITYTPGYGEVIDGTIGTPASHGCVRMNREDCGYIFDNIPYGSTVVIY